MMELAIIFTLAFLNKSLQWFTLLWVANNCWLLHWMLTRSLQILWTDQFLTGGWRVEVQLFYPIKKHLAPIHRIGDKCMIVGVWLLGPHRSWEWGYRVPHFNGSAATPITVYGAHGAILGYRHQSHRQWTEQQRAHMTTALFKQGILVLVVGPPSYRIFITCPVQ